MNYPYYQTVQGFPTNGYIQPLPNDMGYMSVVMYRQMLVRDIAIELIRLQKPAKFIDIAEQAVLLADAIIDQLRKVTHANGQ
jgi:hypothetical protein